MTKNLKVLVELVIDEAKKLREYATQDERDSLNFDTLLPTNQASCIYGQMTGYCYSREALNLIRKCALRVYDTKKYDLNANSVKHLNGEPKNLEVPDARCGLYHSPIEVFIIVMAEHDNPNYQNNNKVLIDYLKGKTDTLEFNFKRAKKKLV